MLKITKLRVEKLEAQAELYEERLKMLECEHTPTAIEKEWYIFGLHSGTSWHIECSECGKIFKEITEREYLVAKLELDEHSFLGTSEEIKKRLAEIDAEADA